jgi:hypothetical protein
MSSEKQPIYVVRVGEKEIEINEETLTILHEYLHRPMSLDELTKKLGFDGWDETYEFLKKVPAWIIWTPPALWTYRVKWASTGKESKTS